MKTRQIRSSVVLAVATVVALVMTPLASGARDRPRPSGSSAFARHAAGSYVVEIPGRSETYLFAFSADGRVISEDSNDFGDGVPAAYQSAFYGTWKRTGRRELVYTALTLGFDAVGARTTTVRHSATVVFDESFLTFHQEGDFSVFTALQDPLDPDEVPVGAGTFSGSGRRIPAVVSP